MLLKITFFSDTMASLFFGLMIQPK